MWGGSVLVEGLRNQLRSRLHEFPAEIDSHGAGSMLMGLFWRGLELVGVVLAALFVVGLGANIMQAGFRITPEALGPKWEKLNPVSGWQRILSLQGVARGGWQVVRVILIAAVVWWVLRGRDGQIAAMASGTLAHSVGAAWDMSVRLIVTVAGSLVAIGVADYAFQWFRNEKQMMMTKQELKEEQKDEEGDPLIRHQRRQRRT